MDLSFLSEFLPNAKSRATILRYLATCSTVLLTWFVVLPAMFGFPYSLPSAISPAWAGELTSVKRQQEELGDSLAAVIASQKETQRTLLAGQIMDAHSAWCEADRDGRRSTGWAERLTDLLDQYERLAGKEYKTLPPCSRT